MEVIVQLAVLIIGAFIVGVCTFLASKVMKLTEATLKLTYELAELQRNNRRLWKLALDTEKEADGMREQLLRLNTKVWGDANEASGSLGNVRSHPG